MSLLRRTRARFAFGVEEQGPQHTHGADSARLAPERALVLDFVHDSLANGRTFPGGALSVDHPTFGRCQLA